jgi:tetratricopeptide (TPR) repeat protein
LIVKLFWEGKHHGVKTFTSYFFFILFSFGFNALIQPVKRFFYISPKSNPSFFILLVSFFMLFNTSFIPDVYAVDDFAEKYRNYKTHTREGKAAFNKKDYEKAISHYSNAIRLSPFETTFYNDRGISYYRLEKYKEAIQDFSKVLVIDSRRYSAYVYRGLCHEKSGNYINALKDYTSALGMKPKDASVHNNLAWLYATAKDKQVQDKEKALEHAKKAAMYSNEESAEILDTLARAYFINGEVTDAIEAEKKTLKIEPNNEKFKENLKIYEEVMMKK